MLCAIKNKNDEIIRREKEVQEWQFLQHTRGSTIRNKNS
jgi:hypothetical protein